MGKKVKNRRRKNVRSQKTLMEMTFHEYMEQKYGMKFQPLTPKQLRAMERIGREVRKDMEEAAQKKRKSYEKIDLIVLD